MEDTATTIRAYRVCLDPTEAQKALFSQSCGANRWAFNYALGRKRAAYDEFVRIREELIVADGGDLQDRAVLKKYNSAVRKQAPKIPNFMDNLTAWRKERGDEQTETDGVSPWWRSVVSWAFSSGMQDADAAWKNWMDSSSGKRAGRRVGFPRFKKKGKARDSYKVFHKVKEPSIRVPDARHILIPRIGLVRLHSSLRRFCRLQRKGMTEISSVTITREADRWFAVILVREPQYIASPSKRQIAAGVVGVDLGVKSVFVASDGSQLANDHLGKNSASALRKAQRSLSRAQKGSNRRWKAARRVARIQSRLAARRQQRLHQITKRLTTGFSGVAIEDLNVFGMTSSAKGTVEAPGKKVKQKAGLNREILDVSFGEFRRQLTYKAERYGSKLTVVDRFFPSSKMCSQCGEVNPDLTLSDRVYRCRQCGLVLDRDLNAAMNLARVGADQLNSEFPSGVRYEPAKPKQVRRDPENMSVPDTCDTRGPEALCRDAHGRIRRPRLPGSVEVRRLTGSSGLESHHSEVILNQPSSRA